MPIWSSIRSSVLVLAVVSGALAATPSGAATFYVGVGTGCTHQFLSQAVTATGANGAGLDIIRIASPSLAIGNLLMEVNNQSVQIVGGFPNCTATTPTGRTLITFLSPDGDDGFWVHGATSERFFGLTNIDMVMGDNAGRGLTLQDLTTVALDNSTISGGQAEYGGNIKLEGDVLLQLLHGSEVYGGVAANDLATIGSGGGIHCQNGGAVYIDSTSEVHDNYADYDGGGIFAFFCSITSEGVIYGNETSGNGAGIYAAGGTTVELLGADPGHLSRLLFNYAQTQGKGGGLFLVDAGTTAVARNAAINDNFGAGGGGGAWVGAGTTFTMDVDPDTCSAGRGCSFLSGNDGAGGGGALMVVVNSTATVRRTTIEGNSTYDGNPGNVASVDGTLLIESCEIFDNDNGELDPEVSRFYVIGTATIAFSTIVETTTADVFWTGAGSQFHLVSSIVQADLTFHAPPFAATLDCIIAKEFASFPAVSPSFLQVTDPALLFVNPAANDFRLKRGSPAQDFCDAAVYSTDHDMENQLRPYDDPTDANFIGAYDLGADEWRLDLFADGFESANTFRWSSVVP